jgi:hypothetical protein
MATSFPEDLDNFSNPAATDSMSGHAAQHANANDAIEALQAKIGVDGSADENSIDYKIAALEQGLENATGDFIPESLLGNANGVASLNSAGKVPVDQIPSLGLAGNNDATIYGIENKTTIDTFSKTLYSTIRYVLQVQNNSYIVSSSIDIVNDGTNLHVNEIEISSNTDNDLVNYELEENAGIISLSVTPISGSVSVRYYRTALKI